MNKDNNNKYLNILTIKILSIEFSISIGNPVYYVCEFKEKVLQKED